MSSMQTLILRLKFAVPLTSFYAMLTRSRVNAFNCYM